MTQPAGAGIVIIEWALELPPTVEPGASHRMLAKWFEFWRNNPGLNKDGLDGLHIETMSHLCLAYEVARQSSLPPGPSSSSPL